MRGEDTADLLVEIAPTAIARIEHRHQIARPLGRQLDQRQLPDRCAIGRCRSGDGSSRRQALIQPDAIGDFDQLGLRDARHELLGGGLLLGRHGDPPPAGQVGFRPVVET